VLCCAVLCCAVRCCAVLCCAVLCCAVLCCAVLCCAVLCCAVRQEKSKRRALGRLAPPKTTHQFHSDCTARQPGWLARILRHTLACQGGSAQPTGWAAPLDLTCPCAAPARWCPSCTRGRRRRTRRSSTRCQSPPPTSGGGSPRAPAGAAVPWCAAAAESFSACSRWEGRWLYNLGDGGRGARLSDLAQVVAARLDASNSRRQQQRGSSGAAALT
jgi:hypothetical protein